MSQLTLFSSKIEQNLRWQVFLSTDLGQLYSSIPFDKIAHQFPKLSSKGVKSIMGVRGGLALQFLKSYLNLSDKKLIERVNSDRDLQLFCGVDFGLHTRIRDKDYVGRWRRWLAQYLEIDRLQKLLVKDWQEDLSDQGSCLMDATCYESHVRYPTDVKLLWECCEWVFERLFKLCKSLKLAKPRSKYKEKKAAYSVYARRKQKGYKLTKKLKKSLLYLLEKGLGQLAIVLAQEGASGHFFKKDRKRLGVIYQVLEQQKELYEHGETAGADRIVSLAKPYLRPIVRGKETKRVEFGVKAHLFELGGLCLIEHLSFNSFNESTRLPSTVQLQQRYTQKKVRLLGADKIYGTRANRKWCKQEGITTNFVPLGRPKQQSKLSAVVVARKVLNKERSTVLEGAFGNQKLHYGLSRIRAKTEATEILWIAFGVWTAAAMKVAKVQQAKAPPTQQRTIHAA